MRDLLFTYDDMKFVLRIFIIILVIIAFILILVRGIYQYKNRESFDKVEFIIDLLCFIIYSLICLISVFIML